MAKIIHLQTFDAPELDVYARLGEAQLRHYYEPHGGLFVAESTKVITRALDAGCKPQSILVEEKELVKVYGADGAGDAGSTNGTVEISEKNLQSRDELVQIVERCGDIPIYTASREVLGQITGINLTKGIFCAMHRPVQPTMEEICSREDVRRIAILEEVVNPTNVGAIFRSAAALGVDAIFLTKACSDPYYRRAARVSMGSVFQIPWTYIDRKWPEEGMEVLKKFGFKTASMALEERSVPIDDEQVMSEEKLAILLGSESYGLSTETIKASDYTVLIPMAHGVDSLNVATAAAVAFWQLCGSRK